MRWRDQPIAASAGGELWRAYRSLSPRAAIWPYADEVQRADHGQDRANQGATTGGLAGDRRMAQAVRDLVAADKARHGVSAQVTQLLAHVPNASVRCDAAGDYG
jgi:hypothetical protein